MHAHINTNAFQTLAFAMEHDFAGFRELDPRRTSIAKAALERLEYEQVIKPVTRGYETRFSHVANEYLGAANDPLLALDCTQSSLAKDACNVGFEVRRLGDELIVTDVWADSRMSVGDRIVAVNGYGIAAYGHQARAVLRDKTGDSGHENWGLAIALSQHFDVSHLQDNAARIPTQRTTQRPSHPTCVHSHMPSDVLMLDLSTPASQENAHRKLIGAESSPSPSAIVIDVRRASSIIESLEIKLLELVVAARTPINSLPGYGPFYLNCSHNNCRYLANILEQPIHRATDDASDADRDCLQRNADEVRELAGTGFHRIDLFGTDESIVAPSHLDSSIYILTDIYTSGKAESIVRIARESGRATVIGRQTMGSLDHELVFTIRLSDSYTFTYPAAISQRAFDGQPMNGIGITPDVAIPWTEQCLERDCDLEKVLELIA